MSHTNLLEALKEPPQLTPALLPSHPEGRVCAPAPPALARERVHPQGCARCAQTTLDSAASLQFQCPAGTAQVSITSHKEIPPCSAQPGQEFGLRHPGWSFGKALHGNPSSKTPWKEQYGIRISDKLHLAEFARGPTVWKTKASLQCPFQARLVAAWVD